MTPQQAQLILKVRDALARNDGQDAYHWLYQFADTTCKDHLTPWDSIETTAANQPSPAQPLTTDEEAAEKYVSIEWYPDYVAKGEAEQSKQSRKDFLAGCTHVRSQQQGEVVAKDAILDILDDVLDTDGSDELGYWIDRQSKEKAAEMIKKLYDPAIFSGSQASNQSEGPKTKK